MRIIKKPINSKIILTMFYLFITTAVQAEVFTTEELRTHPNIPQDRDFYMERFKPKNTSYSYMQMSKDKKEEFRKIIHDCYYDWLGLTDEIMLSKRGDEIAQIISIRLIEQEYGIYISGIANDIVDAHRSPEDKQVVTLPQNIRKENDAYVKLLDDSFGLLFESIAIIKKSLEMK